MRSSAALLVLFLVASAHAQIVERHDQLSPSCKFNTITRWNDSLWVFSGSVRELEPAGSQASTLCMDTTGTLEWLTQFTLPGNEFTELNTAAARTDDTLIVAGWTLLECGGTDTLGYVAAIATDGNIHWQRTLGAQPIRHLAAPDTSILAALGDQVFVLSSNGDSIAQVASPLGEIVRMRTDGTKALLACASGAAVMDATGASTVVQAYPNAVDDIAGYESTGYVLLSGGWLYRTDLNLVPFDSVAYGPVGGDAVLRYDQSYLWVLGNDTARFFTPLLDPALTFTMGAPPGYAMSDAMPAVDVLMTTGSFWSGPMEGSALRSVDKHGALSGTPIDVSLHTLSATGLTFDPLGGSPPGRYLASGSLVAFMTNEGSVPVTDGRLTYRCNLSEPCNSLDALGSAAGGWTLNPGSSIQVYLGGFQDTVSVYDPLVDACMRVSAPNGLMDRDTGNDEACGTIDLLEALSEQGTAGAFAVFPNPCTDRLFVKGLGEPHPSAYRIIDAIGSEELRGTIQDVSIDVSMLPPGCHLLMIDGARAGLRFVKAPR